jgi:hypothetical protein
MALRKKQTLLDQASEYVESARPQVEAAVTTALEAVEDFVENTARPALADARDKAVPVMAAGAAKASQKAVEAATQAKEAADAKVAEVKAGEQKKKGSKLKRFAIFAAVAGVVGFVASKLRSRKESDNWQSSYVPTPAPTTPTTSTTSNSTPTASTASTTARKATAKKAAPKTADPGGASPDEAIADAAEEPHEATTPEAPAEVVDIDAAEDAKQ